MVNTQNKKRIKVKYVDFWNGNTGWQKLNIRHIIDKHYDVELSEEPDYLICSCFGDNYKNFDCIRIMLIGENFSTDWNEYDYGIDFDDYELLDRHFHMINNAFIAYGYPSVERMLTKHLHAEEIFKEKTDFCSYMFSHKVGFRDGFFKKLSEYKKINSGGKCLNNTDVTPGVEAKLEFEKKHKFSIAFENSVRPGYITEKLVDAFAAGTIPIYYGAPDVTKYFNEKAMIVIKSLDEIPNAIERIKEIDNNDELYLSMLKENAVVDKAIFDNYPKEFEEFVCHIFDQPLEEARRRTRYKRRIDVPRFEKLVQNGADNLCKLYRKVRRK